MARVGYCRHGTFTGHGENFQECHQCQREREERELQQKQAQEHFENQVRRIVREELARIGEQNSCTT